MARQIMSSNSNVYTEKCRACMKEGGKMLSMYDDKSNNKINLSYKLAELTSIQIDKFDGLPNMLCSKCAYRTYVLYDFRLKVQESDKKFRMMLENQMSSIKEEEFDSKNDEDIVQTDESLELNISNDDSTHNVDVLENLKVEINETSNSEQQCESHIPQLLENGKENKENNNNLQLNDLFYNIIQEISENQIGTHVAKTDIPEEISKILESQDITIMYVPHDSTTESMSESMYVENTLVYDQKQEENENGNNISVSEMEISNEQKDEISINACISNSIESNVTKKNKRVCCERVDDKTQSKNKQLNNNKSNIEQSAKTEDSDESDSDYFIDAKDNILGSVNDAIVRIKEVKQEDEIEYQCTLCQQNYKQLPCMLLHIVDNHVSSTGPFFCMVCEKDCESHRELRAHVKTHTGRDPYSCFICKKGYSKKRYLKRHMMCHSDFPRHRCSKCGCRFKTKTELDSHMKTHSVPYSCNQCTRVFNHKGNYKRHLVSHLDPQGLYLPKYPCRFCGKRFPNNRTLETHIRVHTGERPFKCQYCEKSFSQRGNLINHTRIHSNPRSYTCEVCGRSFNQRATLRDHGLLHTGEKPHVCNVCGKAFTVSAALRRHMFNHAEKKPFKCETCDMGFVGKYDLRRHMRVHGDRSKEKRKRNTISKSSDLIQQESEKSLAVIEEPSTETIFIEQVLLPQNVTQIVVNQVESEKENEDALFNLHCYNSTLVQYS